jgi:rRNA maturation endonuclease Nob1
MIECYSCGAQFKVKFDENFDADAEVNFCPHCGEELNLEVDFEDS